VSEPTSPAQGSPLERVGMRSADNSGAPQQSGVGGGVGGEITRIYFGAEVTVWRIPADWHPCPWRYKIRRNGVTHTYAGIPNQLETAKSALRKAWHRCKWMHEGTYDDRYKPVVWGGGENATHRSRAASHTQ
jgi:hypothetical protein